MMKSKHVFGIFLLILGLIFVSSCLKQTPKRSQIPNPASVYCEEQGHKLEIRTNPDGSQTGYCIFNDGTECEEWAFYRGQCSFEEAQEMQEKP